MFRRFVGIIVMAVSVLLFFAIRDFYPFDSPFFTSSPQFPVVNPTGKAGVFLASPVVVAFGRYGGVVFAIALFFFGLSMAISRKVEPFKKLWGMVLVPSIASAFSPSMVDVPNFVDFGAVGMWAYFYVLPILGKLGLGILGGTALGVASLWAFKEFRGIFILLSGIPLFVIVAVFKIFGAVVRKEESEESKKLVSKVTVPPVEFGVPAGESSVSADSEVEGVGPVETLNHSVGVKESPVGVGNYIDEVAGDFEVSYGEEEEQEVIPMPPIRADDRNDGNFISDEGDVSRDGFDVVNRREKKEKKSDTPSTISVSSYQPPPLELLEDPPDYDPLRDNEEVQEMAKIIEETFDYFKMNVKVVGYTRGPVVTRFEAKPDPGIRLSKIMSLSDNLALNLATAGVRIVAPIPGKKSLVGIEIPNKRRRVVVLKEVLDSEEFKTVHRELPVVVGKDLSGRVIVEDLVKMPHLLIAGATGSGKSVFVNSLLAGLLYSKHPDEVRFILMDLKVVELKMYNGIPHLLTPVITDPRDANLIMQWLIKEMRDRLRLIEKFKARNIMDYNAKVVEYIDRYPEQMEELGAGELPYIVVIIDEFADLIMTSPREVEEHTARLAAMGRAAGIHLVVATQRPSVDVITGLIKSNFPSRIAFKVASKVDSRTILDSLPPGTPGAEKLLGQGDLLFSSPSYLSPIRVQAPYISTAEVEAIVSYLRKFGPPDYLDLDSIREESGESGGGGFAVEDEYEDALYKDALRIIVTEKKASASYLQRRLKIGYNRAARLIERMEKEGIVGPPMGSKPREVLWTEEDLEEFLGR